MSKEHLQRYFSLLSLMMVVSLPFQVGGDKEKKTMCRYRQHFHGEGENCQGSPPRSCFLQVCTEQPHIGAALKNFVALTLTFIFNT